MESKTELRHLQSAKAFFENGGTGSVFPTYQSFVVFLRRHARELCADGAFIPRQGSAGSLVDPNLIAFSIRRIMESEAHQLTSLISSVSSERMPA